MNLEQLRNICLSLPQVTEDIKWEDHLCFNIGGKIFMITSPGSVPVTASFKVSEEDFEQLIEVKGFSAARYLAKHKWVSIDDISLLNQQEWERLVKQAYSLIASKLPLKFRKNLI